MRGIEIWAALAALGRDGLAEPLLSDAALIQYERYQAQKGDHDREPMDGDLVSIDPERDPDTEEHHAGEAEQRKPRERACRLRTL